MSGIMIAIAITLRRGGITITAVNRSEAKKEVEACVSASFLFAYRLRRAANESC